MYKNLKVHLSLILTSVMSLSILLTKPLSIDASSNIAKSGNEVNLFLDSSKYNKLPKNFRKSSDLSAIKKYKGLNLKGLRKLNISGSAQFSGQNLLPLLKKINTPLNKVIVDLRQESHGFINGIPVSWHNTKNNANIGLSRDLIPADEIAKLDSIKLNAPITFCNNTNIRISPSSIETEDILAKSRDLSYINIPVTSGMLPDDTTIDYFIESMKKLPTDIWLHFHCDEGTLRTTTFMIMYDMMKNCNKTSADDIITRQLKLAKFNDSEINSFYDFKTSDFLHAFYKYCKENSTIFSCSWSHWKEKTEDNKTALHSVESLPEMTISYIKNSTIPIFLHSVFFK